MNMHRERSRNSSYSRMENPASDPMKITTKGSGPARRRPREGSAGRPTSTTVAPAADTWPIRCYQVHFSCEHTGRYFRSSKRRITW